MILPKNKIINTLNRPDQLYPSWLREIPEAPIFIYYQGQPPPPAIFNVAVVGSRKPSVYGLQIIKYLLPHIIKKGFNIISGLARGIDTLAHQIAVNNNGKTWAVLGSGLDNIYPQENKNLSLEIIKAGGGIISEFEPATAPRPENFPRRNRIISGLSMAILIIEAEERSGSLITARHALEQGREVLAVPGNMLSPLSRGTNQLIQSGATPITDADDLLNTLSKLQHDQAK